jgi:hypothetical protein
MKYSLVIGHTNSVTSTLHYVLLLLLILSKLISSSQNEYFKPDCPCSIPVSNFTLFKAFFHFLHRWSCLKGFCCQPQLALKHRIPSSFEIQKTFIWHFTGYHVSKLPSIIQIWKNSLFPMKNVLITVTLLHSLLFLFHLWLKFHLLLSILSHSLQILAGSKQSESHFTTRVHQLENTGNLS